MKLDKRRVRLNGIDNYATKTLLCDKCGRAIIENHKAQMPIYYVIDDGEIIACPACV
jgi:hypothetical protein